jgi:hypothetical protein
MLPELSRMSTPGEILREYSLPTDEKLYDQSIHKTKVIMDR